MLVTLLPYGVLLRPELGGIAAAFHGGSLAAVVGPWGLKFVSAGLIVSVLGAYLAWSLLAAEVLYSAVQEWAGAILAERRKPSSGPVTALWLTNILVQVFLILTLFAQ